MIFSLACLIAVIDGDTLKMDGVRYRIHSIDAPETSSIRANCPEEIERGLAASEYARQIVTEGKPRITRIYYQDQYGRSVADLEIDGADFGRLMIDAGHAQPWDYDGGEKKPDWCDMPD